MILFLGLLLILLQQSLVAANVRSKKEVFSGLKEFGPSLGYRLPPPLVRRDVLSRVKYNPEQWISEPQMTISGAVMFDRQSGITVEQCLEKCAKPQYQDTQTRWVCRSLVYDHKWKICDLFAIIGSHPPYFLSEYKHRDYFQYLAAVPPMDREFKVNASREMSAEVQVEEKKFESTTTTTTTTTSSPWFLKDSDVLTTPPPSELIELTDPVVVKASKQKFENTFADLSKSKEDSVKALASKQTGDSHVLEHKEHESLKSDSSKIEYHRKPSLKFAIIPIKKGAEEEVKSSFEESTTVSSKETTVEQLSTTVKQEETTTTAEQPTIIIEQTEATTTVSQPTLVVEQGEITVEQPTTTISSKEITIEADTSLTTAKVGPTKQIEVEASEIPSTQPQLSTPKSIETYEKTAGFIQIEEEPKTVEVTADIGPISNAQKVQPKIPKRKIQGITTYSLQNTESQKSTACKSGEAPRYIKVEKHERVVESAKKIEALDVVDCAELCSTETEFQCKSAVFHASTCYLFIDSANHSKPNALIGNEKTTYLEQICVPEQMAEKTKLISDAILNYILVGQVQEVTDALTLKKCQLDCLTAAENLGFTCKSAMFYPSDFEAGQNCLLNSESHQSKPDVFVPEDAGVNMIYFIVGEESDDHKKQAFGSGLQSLDSPIEKYEGESNWTKWSKCRDKADAIRHRYLKCTHQKDIRKCPKQSSFCKPPSLQIQRLSKPEFECRAVRSKGRKLCPHGFRYDSRGMRHYCIHPIDC